MLHLFLRVSDKLSEYLVIKLQQMDLSYKKNLSDNTNLNSYFKFLKSLNLRNPYYYTESNKTYHLRNFNGDERNKIFQNTNFKKIFPSMKEADLRQQVWDEFYFLIHDIKDDALSTSEIKNRTKNFFDKFRKITFGTSTTPYIHIFVSHIFQQVDYLRKKNVCINDFSMQGVEKLNDFMTKYYQRASNKKSDFIRQILLKRSRIEILHHHDNLTNILDL